MSYPILSSSVQPLVGVKKAPQLSTLRQKTAANRGNAALAMMPFPTWNFEVDLLLTGNVNISSSLLASFQATYIAALQSGGLFLYQDYNDNTVTTGQSGMLNVTAGAATPMGLQGDGTSTQFQLARSIGGVAWDIIQNLNGSATVYVNGTPTTPSSISSTGLVTFSSAPGSGATLTWAGNFYFLCRFDDDTIEDLSSIGFNSSAMLWQMNSVKFSSEFV
jgi:uncharacterized protein (TIGR02217 family)